jgi:1,2-diacylglycerol 3-beta-galactosyltransferase
LFLSADTGGGHRASAESLAKQFLLHFPGSTYDLLDVWTADGCYPYKTLVDTYKHLSAHPQQWRLLYHISNSWLWEIITDVHSTIVCERKIRKRIASYQPDVIVSVHPAMNFAPQVAVRKLSKEKGTHIPFFTVVTDLGSAHTTWFQKNVDKLYVASERLHRLAKRRGGTPDDKLVLTGLPIRHDFAVQAEALGDRTTRSGQAYQATVKQDLGLDPESPMILVMGGGEGVGSLSTIVDQLYRELSTAGVDATLCVVCGRNEKLQQELAERDWSTVLETSPSTAKRGLFGRWRRRSKSAEEAPTTAAGAKGRVKVIGLGFVTRMAEYMVASDVLVSKAGPGTIAEAAALGLPVMLTSFLPGQEAGNVDFVLDKEFGAFDRDPVAIAQQVASWLQDPSELKELSHKARATGNPSAASEIVIDIGSTTHTWMALDSS